jgi:hypothetical protein
VTSAEIGSNTASGEIGVDAANAEPIDLEVQIVEKARGEQAFECTIRSHLISALRGAQPEGWELPDQASTIVKESMAEFEDPDSDGPNRLLALKGAGEELWEIAPPGLGKALDLIAAAGRQIRSIQITSDEGSIPWELMRPDDDDGRALGVRYPIARWFTGADPLRDTGKPAADARVAAPKNSPPPEPLPKAQAEASLVCEKIPGEKLKATSAVVIEEQLKGWTGTVLHFVCHGGEQKLRLDGSATLSARQVFGMRHSLKSAWRNSAPIVFLNACKTGQAVPTLIGPGGLSRSWTRVGAGAVVAPLWSVRDEVAHDVADYFYSRITEEPKTPYAEIVRDIRAKAESEQEDSFAAYCYFGSPTASAA